MNVTSRRNVLSALPAGVALAAAGAVSTASAATITQSLTTAINNFVPGVGGFVGSLAITSFAPANGVLTAVATLSGNVLNGTGGIAGTITQTMSPAVQVAGSCQILTLTLGPLDLNVLGLMIHLNQVVLNINAVPGAGNLLGNLLCAVANLLNAGGPLQNLLTQLTGLLNQILAAL